MRVWTAVSVELNRAVARCRTHRGVRGEVNLLRQAHEEHVGPLGEPFLVQLLFGGGPLDIVGGLEAAQQVGEGGVNVLGKRGHVVLVASVCVWGDLCCRRSWPAV